MQSEAPGGLQKSVELYARTLSMAGRSRYGEFRSHQAALLPQPPHHQSERHRAAGSGPGSGSRAGSQPCRGKVRSFSEKENLHGHGYRAENPAYGRLADRRSEEHTYELQSIIRIS